MGRRGSDGFTVLELLIVLAIIGTIGVIGHVSEGALKHRATITSCKRAVQEIETSAEIVRARTASYPARVDGSDAAANPLLVSSGTLSRWPKASGYALVWDGSTVQVVTSSHPSHPLGSGVAGCNALSH